MCRVINSSLPNNVTQVFGSQLRKEVLEEPESAVMIPTADISIQLVDNLST